MPAAVRLTAFFLCAIFVFLCLPANVFAYSLIPGVSAGAAILTDSCGRVIFEKNADVRMPMASTTKIMTAILALELGQPDDTVEVDPRAVGVEGSSVYLEAGEKLTLRALVYCLMLASANDAAEAIAYAIAGGIDEFAALMNEKARELALVNTSFKNPHGLDEKGHYTTARELAALSAYALKNPSFAKIAACNSITIESDVATHQLFNHNRLLRSYDGCIGLKTGYTKSSGRCLVSAATRDDLTLICVTLGAPDDWNDHKALLDYGYANFCAVPLCSAGQIFYEMPVISNEFGRVLCITRENLFITEMKGKRKISIVVECPRFLWSLPRPADKLGRVLFYLDGEIAATAELIAHITI